MLCNINGERVCSKTKNKNAENKNADAVLLNPPKKHSNKKKWKRKKRKAFRGNAILRSKKQNREIQKRGHDFADSDEIFGTN